MTESTEEYKFPIQITHFINPHQFYFKFEYGASSVHELDAKINGYCIVERELNHHSNHKPKLHEIVAVFVRPWSKWVRAKVDAIDQFVHGDHQFVLWSIDHGIPLLATSSSMLPLPRSLTKWPADTIHLGGLSRCVPVKQIFNLEIMGLETIVGPKWPENAVEIFEALLAHAAIIHFIPEFRLIETDHYFGELEIQTFPGKVSTISSRMLKSERAMTINHFLDGLKSLKTINKPRWQNNEGMTNVRLDQTRLSLIPLLNEIPPRKTTDKDMESKIIKWMLRNDEDLQKAQDEHTHKFQKVMTMVVTDEPHDEELLTEEQPVKEDEARDAEIKPYDTSSLTDETPSSLDISEPFSEMNEKVMECTIQAMDYLNSQNKCDAQCESASSFIPYASESY